MIPPRLPLSTFARGRKLEPKTNRLEVFWQRFSHLSFHRGAADWPCLQFQIGRLYVRLWWKGTTRWYDPVTGSLVTTTRLE